MRFDPLVCGLLLSSAAGSMACGGDPDASDASASAGDESSAAPHFAVEGRGESGKTSSVLDVVEGQEASRLAITGADAADNLVVIYVTFHGVDTVVGSHVLPIGPVVEDEVFAVGTIDGRSYQSERGEISLRLTSEGHSEGEFEMTLALDQSSPVSVQPGAPEAAAPAAELSMVGTFASEWRVNCRSFIRGFTGGHAVSDSPYCQALTF